VEKVPLVVRQGEEKGDPLKFEVIEWNWLRVMEGIDFIRRDLIGLRFGRKERSNELNIDKDTKGEGTISVVFWLTAYVS